MFLKQTPDTLKFKEKKFFPSHFLIKQIYLLEGCLILCPKYQLDVSQPPEVGPQLVHTAVKKQKLMPALAIKSIHEVQQQNAQLGPSLK